MNVPDHGLSEYTLACVQIVKKITIEWPQTAPIGVRLRAVGAMFYTHQNDVQARITLVLAMKMFRLNGCLNGVCRPEDRMLMDTLVGMANQVLISEGKGSM